jgi:site-specific DNA-methyltransferase (adenine-specific)
MLDYSRDSKTKHPTQKPVALFEYLIKTYTHKGEVVLDNCMGSGTTAVACLNTDRKFIGIEKDEYWYVEAVKRIKAVKLS